MRKVSHLNKQKTLSEKIEWVIALLIAVHELHTGKTSRTQTPYVHHDIKPENILLDNQEKLRLIDFGFATSNLEVKGCILGSRAFMPVSIHYYTKDIDYYRAGLKQQNIFNGLEKDKIAVLRTIYNPIYPNDPKYSLLANADFYKLPFSMQDLLATTNIPPFFADEKKAETEAFFAAVFIMYASNPDIQLKDIKELRYNPELQDKLIAIYKEKSEKSGKDLKDDEDRLLLCCFKGSLI